MRFTLPLPPTVNTYWRHTVRAGKVWVYLSGKGRDYKTAVVRAIGRHYPTDERLKVKITLHFADKRKTDLDNRLKSLLDALAYAGVYTDDSQIDELVVKRGEIVKGGQCLVEISQMRDKANLGELITFLENFNAWRRGADIPMPTPTDIGQALDKAIDILKSYEPIG